MKYKSGQLTNGKYAVFAGSKYFTDTITDTKDKADKLAIVESLLWHQRQMDKLKLVADKSGHFKGENIDDWLA
tara:strand:- start:3215 stop:3433 length:219 start_codon:yes stop_codon:yes gene_type:complete